MLDRFQTVLKVSKIDFWSKIVLKKKTVLKISKKGYFASIISQIPRQRHHRVAETLLVSLMPLIYIFFTSWNLDFKMRISTFEKRNLKLWIQNLLTKHFTQKPSIYHERFGCFCFCPNPTDNACEPTLQ